MQEALYCQWDKERLKVLLYGTAAALPVSTLMHASVKRAFTDTNSNVIQLPQTPAGQKVVKSQRVGAISPGHPTFEAAMRSITAATPSRGAGTPGLSRYATEVAVTQAQSPACTFAARLQDVADTPPKPTVSEKPRVRLKQASGRAPMRALKLSIQQPTVASGTTDTAAIPISAASTARKLPAASKVDTTTSRSGKVATKGFSHFHSRYTFGLTPSVLLVTLLAMHDCHLCHHSAPVADCTTPQTVLQTMDPLSLTPLSFTGATAIANFCIYHKHWAAHPSLSP